MNVIILAAGKGKRLGASKSKHLVELLGKPLILWVVENVQKAGVADRITVVANKINVNEIKTLLPYVDVKIQEKPLGTAHALLVGTKDMRDEDEVLVMYSDTPLIRSSTIFELVRTHRAEQNDMTFLSGVSSEEYPYAFVRRDEKGNVMDIAEHEKPATPPPWEYSIGGYVLKVGLFRNIFKELKPHPETGEYYIPDVLKKALIKGYKVGSYICMDESEYLGINTVEDLKKARELLAKRETESSRSFDSRGKSNDASTIN